ncbi:reverse transcriptase domain-containing protein [Tanacetum coccineum]
MCKEGIVLGHKISKSGIEVDRANVDVIVKLPHPTTVKGVRSFLGHAGFYRRFIQDFSKISRPITYLLEKDTPFVFSQDCINAFETLKKKLTEAPILVVPDWNLPFELMCDASDFTIGAVLGQRTDIQEKYKKKAKDKQIQARSGKGKVKSHQNEVIQLEGTNLPTPPKKSSFPPQKPSYNWYALAKIISSTLHFPPSCIKVHVGNPSLFPKHLRWLRLSTKKLKRNQRLGFALDYPHTTSTLVFISTKKHKLQDEDLGYK